MFACFTCLLDCLFVFCLDDVLLGWLDCEYLGLIMVWINLGLLVWVDCGLLLILVDFLIECLWVALLVFTLCFDLICLILFIWFW